MTPPTDERVKELRDYFAHEASPSVKPRPTIVELEKILRQDAGDLNIEIKPDGSITAVNNGMWEAAAEAMTELLATRQALREAGEALLAGADSLLVEQTRWERRRHISGLLADKLTAEKIGAQSAQLRALAGPLPPLPTLPEMGKERE